MIKKKDYELIAEAYELITEKAMPCTCECKACKSGKCKDCSCNKCECKGCKCTKKESLNECWEKMSAPQKSKVEQILKNKSGYKIGDHAWSDDKKTVTLTHELGSDTERDIIVDEKGDEVVHTHSGMHKESKDSIADHATFDPEELTRKFINDARQSPENHKAHGSLAALRFLKGKKEGIVPENPHVKGSPAAQNWQEGWNEIMEMDDKAGKAEVQAGKVHTTPAGAAPGYNVIPNAVKESAEALEEKKMACGKGCTCGKCPKCMPKKKKSMKESLEEAYETVAEAYGLEYDAEEDDEKLTDAVVARAVAGALAQFTTTSAGRDPYQPIKNVGVDNKDRSVVLFSYKDPTDGKVYTGTAKVTILPSRKK